MDDLGERALDYRETGAKNFMAPKDFIDGSLQDGDIERSQDAKAYGDIPARVSRFETVEIPKGLLRQACGKPVQGLAQRADCHGSRSKGTDRASDIHITWLGARH